MSDARLLVEPAFLSVPPYAYTLGREVSDLCAAVGFRPDPEQDLALDAMFGYTPDHHPAAFEGAVIGPRQNIKTGFEKQCALGWLYIDPQPLAIWSAHEFATTAQSFLELKTLIDGSDDLTRLTRKITEGRGSESIETMDGSRLVFRARAKTSGRGLAAPRVILDEAFALLAAHIGSLMPVMSTFRGQMLYGSSAGHLISEVLRGIRDRGRPGGDPSLFYVEWCDDLPGTCTAPRCSHLFGVQGCILDDVERWARANSQLAHGEGREHRRITVDHVRNERRAMTPDEFFRERMGRWEDPPAAGGPYGEAWASCLDPDSEITGKVHFALAVANERDAAAIAVAGKRADGLVHVEVIHHDRGTDWAIGVLQKLREKWGVRKVMLDKQSAAASLITDLEAASFEVDGITTAQYAQACGRAFDAVTAEAPTLRHIGQPELDTAVDGTSKRDIGDAYGWDRKEGTDITPHDAATIAAWGVSRKTSGSFVTF